LEHPYENPLEPLKKPLPPSDNSLRHTPIPWYKSGIAKQDFPWIDLDTSLQWQAFRRTVETLQRRGNRVFVLVGPFNEHMLEPESLKRYQKIKSEIANWLEEANVTYYAPPALASELYGDASHPLAAGYDELARQLKDRLP
jgi:DNA-binding transcriptional regulator of glucitol operon